METQTKIRSNEKKANEKGENKTEFFCEVGERKMEINVNCKEMRFVIRNLVDIGDVSLATAPKIPFDAA